MGVDSADHTLILPAALVAGTMGVHNAVDTAVVLAVLIGATDVVPTATLPLDTAHAVCAGVVALAAIRGVI